MKMTVLPSLKNKNSFFFLVVFSAAIFLPGCRADAQETTKENAQKSPEKTIFSENESDFTAVRPVKLPEKLFFAGEEVPLNDPEIRERMIFELEHNVYRHASTLTILRREGRWHEIINKILRENDVPEDFFYLAVAESDLDEYAVSPARALGFWQFLESASQDFKLEISEDTDFRKDPEEAARAACDYLKKAKKMFGSWTNAAASYNRGMSGLKKALETQKVNSYYDLYLNRETARYLFRILALKLIIENPSNYGFQVPEADKLKPLKYKELIVNESITDLPAFALSLNLSYRVLKIYNPWLDSKDYKLTVEPGKSYTLRLPEDTEIPKKEGE